MSVKWISLAAAAFISIGTLSIAAGTGRSIGILQVFGGVMLLGMAWGVFFNLWWLARGAPERAFRVEEGAEGPPGKLLSPWLSTVLMLLFCAMSLVPIFVRS